MMVGPVVAGLVLTAFGFRAGFLLSALFYGVAAFWVSRVSPRPAGGRAALPANRPVAHRWRIDRAAMAFLGVSFLTWQGNVLAMAYTFHLLHRQSFGYGITLAVWGGAGFVSSVVLPRIRTQRQWLWVALMFLVLALCWAVLAHGISFWPFVAIGGFEGMATWVIQDLVAAHVLAAAPAGQAGVAQARLGFFDKVGSVAGTVLVIVMPGRFLILPWFHVLAWCAAVVGVTFLVVGRWRHRTPIA